MGHGGRSFSCQEFSRTAERGQELNLTDDELASYDALADNGSDRELMGETTLATMARELASALRKGWATESTATGELAAPRAIR